MTMFCITSTGDSDHLGKQLSDVFMPLYEPDRSRDAGASPAIAAPALAMCAGNELGRQRRCLWGMDRTISRTLLRKSVLPAIERTHFA